ncbi:ABC transporter permease [Nonomuraea longicatena]|uniref:Transport permease protein n=1 Tax=Nonomuraea longicatena TaxID=83682 RepID=A0ABN1NTZ6_9ACTN
MKILAVETKMLLRDWPAPLIVLALPLGVLLILGSIPSFSEPNPDLGGQAFNDTQMPALMLVLSLLTVSLTVLPGTLATYRERGILRRMSTTPVHPMRVLGVQLFINLVLGALAAVLLIVMAKLVLGSAIPKQLPGFVLVFLLGTAALLSMGLVIAALAKTAKVAPVIGSVAMTPMMFVSGMWTPREIMPPVLRTISDYSVGGPLAAALRDTWAGNAPQPLHLVVMAVAVVVFGGLAVRLFRWE